MSKKTKNICVFGYYGFHNLGDDLMLLALIQHLQMWPQVKKVIVFVNEDYYSFSSDKVKTVPVGRGILQKIYYRIIRYLHFVTSDMALWGGGTCLYEPEHGEYGSLKRLCNKVSFFSMVGKPYIFLGTGIGTISSNNAKKYVRKILRKSSMLCLRDPFSEQKARELEKECVIRASGDLVFLLENEGEHEVVCPKVNKLSNIAFCGTYYHYYNDSIVKTYANTLNCLIEQLNIHIHFVPFHGGLRNDNKFHTKIADQLERQSFTIHEHNDPSQIISLFKMMDFVIGIRLHSVVLADLFLIPNVAVEYSPKVCFYVEKSNILKDSRLIPIGKQIPASLISQIYTEYPSYKTELKRFISDEKKLVMESIQVLQHHFLSV